jgi:hypothetical protein
LRKFLKNFSRHRQSDQTFERRNAFTASAVASSDGCVGSLPAAVCAISGNFAGLAVLSTALHE